MFRPNDFFANFVKHKDFSKSSKFHVELFKPANLAFGQLDFRELKFQCEAAELPGYNINTVDAKIYGVSSPVAVSSKKGEGSQIKTFLPNPQLTACAT